MITYFRTVFDDAQLGRVERLWAISSSGAVKRTVDLFDDQTSRANSIAILSHRSGHFADFAGQTNDPCLLAHAFKSIPEWTAAKQDQGHDPAEITKAMFEQSFRRATPDI